MKNFIKTISQKASMWNLNYLCIGIGIIGIVGGLYYALHFPAPGFLSIGLFVVYGLLVAYFYQAKQMRFVLNLTMIYGLTALGIFFLFAFETGSLLNQLKTIIQFDYYLRFDELFLNLHMSNGLLPIAFFSVIAIPLCYVIVSLFYKDKFVLLKICFLIFVFVFPILIRHQLNTITSYFSIFFFIYVFLFRQTLKYQKNTFVLQGIVIVTVSVFLLLAHVFLEPNPIFKQGTSTVLTQMTSWVDNSFFNDMFRSHNTTGISSSIQGGLPTDSVSLNDQLALVVTTDKPFSSYLRGYSLANYEDNEWHPVQQSYNDFDSLQMFTNYVKGHFHSLSERKVKIESVKSTSYQFVPYYPLVSKSMIADSYYQSQEETMTTLAINMDNIEDYIYELATSQKKYQKYVTEEYLSVPNELKDKLMQFINQNSANNGLTVEVLKQTMNEKEMADYIRKLLSETTVYDIDAGKLPENRDFVDYFLFENKKGSCTHYATTGTLLLRCLGVPARYTTGFLLKSSDFKEGTAQIRNYRSHAWVEIYLENRGWIPIEMTPAQTLSQQVDILDQLRENSSTTQTNQNAQTSTTTTNENQQTTSTTENRQGNSTAQQVNWTDLISEYSHYFIAIIVLILISVGYRIVSRKYMTFKVRRKSSNQEIILYYCRVQRMSRFGQAIPENIVQIANKAKFSQHQMTDEEMQQMIMACETFAQEVYQSLRGYHRFIFKFIFGYI